MLTFHPPSGGWHKNKKTYDSQIIFAIAKPIVPESLLDAVVKKLLNNDR
jgi:hypothetical protein